MKHIKISNNIDLPWNEKHRPKKIDDLILDENIKKKINYMVNNNNISNMIISGTPGLGKTTTALCIAKHILGNNFNEGVTELNASDDRGLEAINNTIIHFCKKKLEVNGVNLYKIIILDEADNITKKAQTVLSNYIETYKHNTRFIFTCNDHSKIIESIQSKCILLNYSKLSDNLIKTKIKQICEIENVKYSEDGLDALIYISHGDIRQCMNFLEGIYYGYGELNKENVYKICDQPQPVLIINIIKACLSNNINQAIYHTNEIKKNGYCVNDIVIGMLTLLKDIKMDEETRMKYIDIVNETYIDTNNLIESDLQLYACLAKMIKN